MGMAAASVGPQDWNVILSLTSEFRQVWGGLGIHPWTAAALSIDEIRKALEQLDEFLYHHREIRFIGECGLDALRPNIELQKYAFAEQIALANKYRCMLVVHCHKMWHEMPKYLSSYSNVIFHGFGGSREIQLDIIKRDGYVSLGRAVLRKTAPVIIPELLERAVIETDDDGQHNAISLSDVVLRIENYNIEKGNALAKRLFNGEL